MRIFAITELFGFMEDSEQTWENSQSEPITRAAIKTGEISSQALAKSGDAPFVYFWIRERNAINAYGYTICRYRHSDSGMEIVSVCAQFLNERKADEALNAYALDRIDSGIALGAFRARQADTVADVLAYKRNATRAEDVKTFRANQRARVIPAKAEAQAAWLTQWIRANMSQEARTALAEAISA